MPTNAAKTHCINPGKSHHCHTDYLLNFSKSINFQETAATNIIQCILDSEKFLPGEYLNVNCKAQLSNFVQKEQNQQSLIKFSDELIYQFNQKMSCMNT